MQPSTASDEPDGRGRSHRSRSRRRRSRRGHSRRAVLAAAGTGVVASLAGCSVLDGDDDAGSFHPGDWHAYGADPGNTNHVAGGAPEPAEHEHLESASWPYVPPVVHDEQAYFATEGRVVAVGVNGVVGWRRSLPDRHQVSGAPAIDPERRRLYVPFREVPRSDGPDPAPAYVGAYDLGTGFEQWRARVGDHRTYGVTVHIGEVYVRSATACVRLGPDGTERWRTSLDPLAYDEYNLSDTFATQVAPAVKNSGVYVPNWNTLVKLDSDSGEERWRVDAETPYAAPVIDDGGVVQTGWQGIVATDRYGNVRWRRDLQTLAAAAVDGTDVYIFGTDLHALDGTTGETNWSERLGRGGGATAAPVVTDDSVVVDADNPIAYRRNAGGLLAPDRQRWSYNQVHTSTYASPVVAADRLLAVGPSGLYAFEPADA